MIINPRPTPKELNHLVYLSDAIITEPETAARMIESARLSGRHTSLYLGVLAVIEDVSFKENGKPLRPENIIREALVLTEEESIFHIAGVALAGAGEMWLHRQDVLTDEQEEIDDQIAAWRQRDLQDAISSW